MMSAMSALSLSARPLVDPIEGVAAVVEGRRWLLPLLALMVFASLSAVVLYFRWDASGSVISQLTMSGEISRVTEQEFLEQVATAQRKALVAGVAKGLLWMPLFSLLLATALKLTGWLIGQKALFVRCFTAATVGLLPMTLYHLVFSAVAFHQLTITDGQLQTLVPSALDAFFPHAGPKLIRVLKAVDFFNLWSAGLMGLGFAAASGMRKHRGALLGLWLYVLYAGVFIVGLPGMMGGEK